MANRVGAAQSDAVAAARAVAPVVAAGRGWAEAHARLAPDVVRALGEAGLFRLVAPLEVGGWEASLPDQLVVHETLGAADPSAAWCVTNAAVAGRAAAYLDDRSRALLFAEPSSSYAFSNLAAGTATPVDGGYRVSGRWSVVSGAAHADWAVLGARVEGGGTAGEPREAGERREAGEVRWMLLPAGTWTVEATWDDASAMRGSGSHTVTVTDAWVPEGLAHSWDRPLRVDRPLYRLRYTSVTGTAAAAISLGVLRAAIEQLTSTLSTYRSSLDGANPRDWPNVQQAVAELTATRNAAWSGLVSAAEEVWSVATAEPAATVPVAMPAATVPVGMRAALFAAADHAVQVSLAGVSRAYVCGTGKVLQRGHPLEQALRDVHGMAVNWERIRRMVFDAGGVLLGREPRYRAM
jgi:alkylation response protein AidB-like acyl-CoA dehydrogenase